MIIIGGDIFTTIKSVREVSKILSTKILLRVRFSFINSVVFTSMFLGKERSPLKNMIITDAWKNI